MVSLSGLAPAQRAVPIPPPATKKKAAGPVPVPIPVVAPVVAPASVPSPIPNPNTMKIEETPLTPVMINLLRFQMVAYSHLSKNQPVPALVLKGIMDPGSMDFDEEFRDFFGNSGAVEQPSTPASEPDKVSQVARQVFQEIEEQKREDYRRETLKKNKEADPVELKRQFPPVRVTRDSNPYLLLKKKLTRVEHAALAHKLLIPSITPTGIDVAALTEERERYIRARILNRAEELENLPVVQSASTVAVKSEHPEETDGQQVDAQERILPESPEEVKALIEYKALRLVDKQKRLREEIVQGMAKATQLAVAVDRQAYRKWKRHSTREVRGTDRIEQTQRAERQSKQKIRQHEFISSIVSHGKDLFAARRNRDARMSKLGQMVLKLHTKIEKEELARLETLSKERLRALREDDEEAYLKLVQESKNTRIVHILGQTTDFLRNLTNQVIAQKETVGELEGVPDVADAEEEDEEEAEMARNKDYYGVAHKVKELIEKQPDMLVGGELKEYQLKGLQWMVSLYNNRLNGILADEMGLGGSLTRTRFRFRPGLTLFILLSGKTIQTISLLVYLHEKKKQPGPFLIIVPLSTMTNWAMELEKWAPGLKKVVFKGNPQQRRDLSYIIRNGDFNVVLTTYEYVIRERPVLSKIKWVHMIIDEGHRVKNKNSKLVQTLTQFYTTRYRLILTGTPLQVCLPIFPFLSTIHFMSPKTKTRVN